MRASAARTARSGSSSWARGAPHTAISSSPMILSTVPPCASITGTSAPKQSSRSSFTASGSRPSAMVVNPARSAKATVTTRRSPAATRPRATPQDGQNRAAAAASRRSRAGDGGHGGTLKAAVGSDAVGAELALGVGQLAGVLDEEAGLADELARALGLDPAGAVAALLGLGRLFLLVVLFLLGGGDAVLQDGVEVGLDVVGVGLLLVLVLARRRRPAWP